MKFTISLRRKITSYRTITVEAASSNAARRRALAIAREAADIDENNGEHDSEWCDDMVHRPFVHEVVEGDEG